MNQTNSAVEETNPGTFGDLDFKRLLSRCNRSINKVRRIDVDELLELAWVDGVAKPFAERLLRSRPDLQEDVQRVLSDLGVAS